MHQNSHREIFTFNQIGVKEGQINEEECIQPSSAKPIFHAMTHQLQEELMMIQNTIMSI